MKVFISHSSRDRWVARKLSEEINTLGAKTFLDEKDIETGDSIDTIISNQLKECDELLILLSPSSLNSHWVLIEVGGAKALNKRLVPILLHIGANEIPAPISKHLARDINEIHKYYKELKNRLEGKEPLEKPVRRPLIRRRRIVKSFKEGDKVVVARTQQSDVMRDNYALAWEGEMGEYCGKSAVVTEVDEDKSVHIDIDNGEHWWAFEWLSKDTSIAS